MHLEMNLDATCDECGEEEVTYYTKDETETIDEVYVQCRGCGYEYPKRVVKKSNDRDRAEIAQEIVN